jgi:hypothetical protein
MAAVSARNTRAPSETRLRGCIEPPPVRCAEATLRADGDDDATSRPCLMRESRCGIGVECELRGSCVQLVESRGQRRRCFDARRRVAAALLAGTLGNSAPVLHAALGSFRVELDDAEFAIDRHDATDPELRRLLYDEIHGVGLRQRLQQRQIERRLRYRRVLGTQIEHGTATLQRVDTRVSLRTPAVEGDQLVAALQAQHVA